MSLLPSMNLRNTIDLRDTKIGRLNIHFQYKQENICESVKERMFSRVNFIGHKFLEACWSI